MLSSHLLLHLSLIKEVGPSSLLNLIHAFKEGDLQRETLDILYRFKVSDFMNYGQIGVAKAQLIYEGLGNKQILDAELSLIQEYGVEWFTLIDKDYPERLKNICVPPVVLYKKGAADLSTDKQLAVVGSRKGDSYGEDVLRRFIPELVEQGWAIVSGGAVGIDTMAHRLAVECGGSTIAVLGAGLEKLYPASNKNLFGLIVDQGGSLVSPYPLLMDALPANFPARNRIIAGLARGCLVIQATVPSGALITAQFALNEGRELLAVPGAIDNPLSAGCHKLISEGAAIATSTKDILQALGEQYDADKSAATSPVSNSPMKEIPTSPATPVQQLLQLCSAPITFDELTLKSGLTAAAVQEYLWDLMLEGKVSQSAIGLWQKV